jgi:hypothetical protein
MLKIQKLFADSQSKMEVAINMHFRKKYAKIWAGSTVLDRAPENLPRIVRRIPATMSGSESGGDEPSKHHFKEFWYAA